VKAAVVTPWDGKHEDLLSQCLKSTQASKIPHLVIRCGQDWENKIFELRDVADVVLWVDADDVVYEDAIERCIYALENSDVGVAYTDEAVIDIAGTVLKTNTGPRSLLDIASHPNCVHHLVATRAHTIDLEPLKVFEAYADFNAPNRGCPLDWLMRARSACRYGLVHVPMVGYGWRRRPEQISSDRGFASHFATVLPQVRQHVRSWIDWTTANANSAKAAGLHL
jgi:hypothetical protein